jgi:hypothetical protein
MSSATAAPLDDALLSPPSGEPPHSRGLRGWPNSVPKIQYQPSGHSSARWTWRALSRYRVPLSAGTRASVWRGRASSSASRAIAFPSRSATRADERGPTS